MWRTVPQLSEMCDPLRDSGPWARLACSSKQGWKGLVAKAALAHQLLPPAVPPVPPVPPAQDGQAPGAPPPPVPPPRLTCYDCGYEATSMAQLRSHAAGVHGFTMEARAYAPGSHCRACLKQFWDRPRLLWHLGHDSPACMALLTAYLPPLSPEQVAEGRAEDAAQKRERRRQGLGFRWAKRKCVVLRGPVRDWAGPVLTRRGRHRWPADPGPPPVALPVH